MILDDEQCYRAAQSRDSRFDGCFITAVKTTGIYCRPSCPAMTPKRHNVEFFVTAAAAQQHGYRACKRCRPDASPGSPEWNVRADVVGRAMRLIADGLVDREGVGGLAARLSYSERQINRLLTAELGAGPLALARAQRAQTARTLIETTSMPITQIAFAAGFASVRQFNDTIREVFASSPTELRGSRQPIAAGGTLSLRLPYRAPFHSESIFRFLGDRAVPGVETWDGATYRRSLRLSHGNAVVALSAGPSAPGPNAITCTLHLDNVADAQAAVQRCRRLLDLDADPDTIESHFAEDPILGPLVRKRPGVRSPGHPDGVELLTRAVLGQQVSVKGARTLAARLVAAVGEPLAAPVDGVTHAFPSAEAIAGSPTSDL
ncbi:MAG TPA: AlkA N-terminal domain-containing protein, partial [Ilumatobacteraceae bacterium]|nr:AlkA N-terminal domain-containing protein [Ilumatobacteraceae bacterium]